MVWINGLAKHLLAVDGLFVMPFRPPLHGRIGPLGQVQNPVAHGREVEPRGIGPLEAVEQRALAKRFEPPIRRWMAGAAHGVERKGMDAQAVQLLKLGDASRGEEIKVFKRPDVLAHRGSDQA
jgi:hypothetical protein